MAARLDDLHRPLLEPAPQPIPTLLPDSLVSTSLPTEMSDMASEKVEPNPNSGLDAIDEYDVITETDVETHGAKSRMDGQKKQKKAQRVTWQGYQPDHTHSRRSHFVKDEEDEVAENLQEIYDQEFRVRPSRGISNITVGSEGSVIDGRFSASFSVNEDGFVSVEDVPYYNADMSTTRALVMCNKYVLRPYHGFLKVIGWRRFGSTHWDSVPWFKRVCNVAYPTFIFIMLLCTCTSQILICFSRTSVSSPVEVPGSNVSVIECERGLLTINVLPAVLILMSYIWAFILFRFIEPEHLSTLIETVFLTYHVRVMGHSQKRLVFILLLFLVLGVVWLVFSTAASIARIFALGLTEPDTVVSWFVEENRSFHFVLANINESDYSAVRWSFAVFSLVGFLFFDMLYIALMVNYSSQCELLKVYVKNIKLKVCSKSCLLGDAVKEIFRVYEFLNMLNGQFGYVTSLIFFVFLQNAILSVWNLLLLEEDAPVLNVTVGFLNIFQWLVITLFPIVQAARLTSECRGLRALGLEIGARPYVFSDTPQLVLDSFVSYTSATDYKAKLAFVPVYPEFVLGAAFVLAVIASAFAEYNHLPFAPWI